MLFGLGVGAVLIVTTSIAEAIGAAADAYGAVGVTTAEEAGKTDRWETVTTFLSGLFSGATAALV